MKKGLSMNTPVDRAPYDFIAEAWDHARTGFRPADQAFFQHFTDQLKPRSRILDLGCGTGLPITKLLVALGMNVTGVDRSRELLAKAKVHVPEATFILAEMESYEPDGNFDAAVIWDSLFHLPRALHQPVLERMFSTLHAGGTLVLTSGGSQNEPFVDKMFDVEFFYDAHSPETLKTLVQAIGFSILHETMLNIPDGNRDKGRLALILKK